MNARYLSLFSGLTGVLFLVGSLFAAQPESGSGGVNFSDKPHAPVDVVHHLQSSPAAGQSLDIELQFRTSGSTHQLLEPDYRSEPGLTISGRGEARMVEDDAGDNYLSQTITVIPATNGLYHLTVYANIRVNGQPLSRVVSVPLQVGSKSDSPVVLEKPAHEMDINGVPIKSMPAKTTISQN